MISLTEILAVVFTLICIYFTIKNNVNCWWTGIVSNLLYFVVFYNKHIYADMSLQMLFIIQGAWAWWMWTKPRQLYFALKISKSNVEEKISYYLSSVFIWASLIPILVIFNGNNPPADALVTTFSIMGIYLTGKRKIESWHFWILTDIISIILYYRTGLYLSCGLYFVCLAMAYMGLKKWKKLYEIQQI